MRLAERLSAIVAEDLRRTESECVTCRAVMLRPARRHGDLPLWTCASCRAKATSSTSSTEKATKKTVTS